MPLGVPTGALRAPGSNAFSCVFQSFIDELAHAAGKDPVQFRLDLLTGPRKQSRQGQRRVRSRRARPACSSSFARSRLGHAEAGRRHRAWASRSSIRHRGYFAEVAEVTVDAATHVKVNKVWVAGDIGSQIINPSMAINQVQGVGDRRPQPPDGVGDHVRRRHTRCRTTSTSTSPSRIAQAPPEIEVHFLKTNNPPTGLGEPALPPCCRRSATRSSPPRANASARCRSARAE